jgi:hypothetical protein
MVLPLFPEISIAHESAIVIIGLFNVKLHLSSVYRKVSPKGLFQYFFPTKKTQANKAELFL